VPGPRGGDLPLSFAQQRLWLIDQLEPASPAYNLPAALRLRGTLAVPALTAALAEIVRRHEILRTVFRTVDGEPLQVVAPPLPVSLPVVDLSGLPAAEFAAEPLIGDEARRPFDLARGPLVRFQLLRLGLEDHIAILNMHHIVSDGWSGKILIQELTALYRAFLAGEPSPLAELPIQYADFALWQRGWLKGEALESELACWREQLLGLPPVLELPSDRPRPPVQGTGGRERSLSLPDELSAELAGLARREAATLFMVLLSAFQTLLHRYSGKDDISVGTPVAGRNRVETEQLIGFFVNTLVLRGDLAGDPDFLHLLARLRDVTLQAYRHQDLPFEKLVEELRPERSLSHTPLFQVMFALQNESREELELPGAQITPLSVETRVAKFDLLLDLSEAPSGLAGTLQYRTDLFDAATMERMAGHFQQLLRGLVRAPGRRLSELELLSEPERFQLLEWNATEASYDTEESLHGLFEAQARRTPELVAVEFADQALSYAELDERANRLAWRLQELGVGPEALVGVCAERSIEMVVGLLAVLKAGGAYVPLDPDHPRERLAYVLDEARVPVLLVQSHLADRLPASGAVTVTLDAGPAELAAWPAERPRAEVRPEGLVYVIYTSGSTGKPKGAMNTHRAVVNRLAWMQSAYRLGLEDAVLQKTPFGFDVSVWEFFWPLATGARLVMALPGGHQDPEYLASAIERHQITTLHFVPSMLSAFLEATRLERCREVRQVIASGEALAADLAARFFARLPWAELHNLYGPTAAAIDVTAWTCARDPGLHAVPIGRPIDNLRIYLLDAALTPIPVGVTGELYIGGIGLARGYVRRPDLTAERFLPDPGTAEAGARMYRTGDLARFLADGAVEYLGRVDYQVKIRGLRIELGEIEAALGAHPGLREAVVLARADTRGDLRLVAYAVPGEGAAPTTAELAQHLSRSLPAYMVPSSFVLLPAFPLNPNGKVDRRALPEPSVLGLPGTNAYAMPRTPVEELLCAIWADVLGLSRVGIHDNFFALGGHSLLVPRVLSRLRQAFGIEVPSRALFERPTVSGLAESLERAKRRHADPEPPLVRSTRCGSQQPLSFAQLRFWARRHEVGASNVPFGVQFSGFLNVAALERSLQEIMRRHEVLRASFEEIDDEPVQIVRGHLLVLPVVDLSRLPAGRRQAEAGRLGTFFGGYPFDLARGPLLITTLLRLADDEHMLVLVQHHLVTDGWSEGLLSEELAILYRTYVRGEPSPLPELPIQYADFAAWQRQWLQGPVFDELLGYWQQRLHAFKVIAIPTDHPRPAVRSVRGGRYDLRLDGTLSRGLRELGRRENATLFMTLLAVWNTFLRLWTGEVDITLTTNIANRGRAEVEPLIGLFTNVLVLRTDLSGDPSFSELLARVRETTLADFAHQDLPFVEILSRARPGRVSGYNELFPVGFVLQNVPVRPVSFPDLAVRLLDLDSGAVPRDLILIASEDGDEIETSLLYRQDIFEEATIMDLLIRFEELLRMLVHGPEERLSSLAWDVHARAL